VVKDIQTTIKLPAGPDPGIDDDPLTLPDLIGGPQAATGAVRGVGLDGVPDTADDVAALGPAEQGQTEFVVRGEVEGYHRIDFDIKATLDGLPVGPVAVKGKATGGVLVQNPFFNMTFTVPSVARRNELFKLFVTVNNIGKGVANDVSVNLDASRMSGVDLVGEGSKRIATIPPGDSKVVEFDFRSQKTGKVVATYLRFDAGAGVNVTGNLNFTLGVGERNVPHSPDTLVLPSPVDQLPPVVVEAAMRVLGHAWSVANASPGTLPRGVTRTSPAVVTQKALALAEAGLRLSLGEAQDDALRDLVFDLFGHGEEPLDPGWDQAVRETEGGRELVLALGSELAAPVASAGGVVPYER
ncbi:MAG: hypothetical protein ACRDKW_12190, partial [Actinomycetota bacterium]